MHAEHLERLGLRASAERLRGLKAKMAARVGQDGDARRALAHAWMEASLHLALALDAG
jgi:hypothetical protein